MTLKILSQNCAPLKPLATTPSQVTQAKDEDWMRAAIELGRRGLGSTWPNPSVGCILVKDGRVIARGRTQAGGRPHAETQALEQAGAKANGATAYVSLEPCAHHATTPPCAEALVKAGVARVVIGAPDPDPRVNGAGRAILEAAGIAVSSICTDDAAQAQVGFLTRITHGRPYFCVKLATTLDGAIATQDRESKWITGPEARRRVHMMRAQFDAVMVGRGTAEDDDPMLDVRDLGIEQGPVRVVLDTHLNIPVSARLVATADTQPSWIVHGPDADVDHAAALKAAGCELINVDNMEIGTVATALGARGLTRVLCEGGATLAASLVGAELADQLVVFSAGMVFGAGGLRSIGALDFGALSKAPKFDLISTSQVGQDIMTVWEQR